MIKTIADGIRFLLEIATVVLLIIAGFNSSDLVVKLTVGVIVPVLGILFGVGLWPRCRFTGYQQLAGL